MRSDVSSLVLPSQSSMLPLVVAHNLCVSTFWGLIVLNIRLQATFSSLEILLWLTNVIQLVHWASWMPWVRHPNSLAKELIHTFLSFMEHRHLYSSNVPESMLSTALLRLFLDIIGSLLVGFLCSKLSLWGFSTAASSFDYVGCSCFWSSKFFEAVISFLMADIFFVFSIGTLRSWDLSAISWFGLTIRFGTVTLGTSALHLDGHSCYWVAAFFGASFTATFNSDGFQMAPLEVMVWMLFGLDLSRMQFYLFALLAQALHVVFWYCWSIVCVMYM